MTRYFGVDLAWGEGTAAKAAKETGVALVDRAGRVLDAGWVCGVSETARWVVSRAEPGDVIAVDAPLVVTNPTGMRLCEREVGSRYGRWKVAANATNLTRAWLGGVTLAEMLLEAGFAYDDGREPHDPTRVSFFECYPYTTLVGAPEFGYDIERPRYKRPNLSLPADERRRFRADECDELIRRVASLASAEPPLILDSHPTTAELLQASPLKDAEYKHREDLLDALLCAWTAALWTTHGRSRCQVLGEDEHPDPRGYRATIIAPAKPRQRGARIPVAKEIRSVTTAEALNAAARQLAAAVVPADAERFAAAEAELLATLDALRELQCSVAGDGQFGQSAALSPRGLDSGAPRATPR